MITKTGKKKYINIEAIPTNKGLKNVFVRTEHGFVHFKSITDARVVWILQLINELNRRGNK